MMSDTRPGALIHIARAGTSRFGWWETFCGHLHRGTKQGVAPISWVALYGLRYITCQECIAALKREDAPAP